MFNYSIKVKIFWGLLLLVIIVVIVLVLRKEQSRGFDLYEISQVKNLATSLERYFDKKHTYPEVKKISLSDIKIITENGINKSGENIYYRAVEKPINATFISIADRYIIEFDLSNSWDIWGLGKKGGKCRVSNYLEMVCRSYN